jgi:hypothetical protein
MRTKRDAVPRRDGPLGHLVSAPVVYWGPIWARSKSGSSRFPSELRSDAFMCNTVLVFKYEDRRGITFRRRSESGALKCNRALGLKYDGRTGLRSVRSDPTPLYIRGCWKKIRRGRRQFEPVSARGSNEFRWVYTQPRNTVRSEGNEDSTPAVRRIDGI